MYTVHLECEWIWKLIIEEENLSHPVSPQINHYDKYGLLADTTDFI